MNWTTTFIALAVSAGTTYAAADAGLFDLAQRALTKAEAVGQLNQQETERAAAVLFEVERGRKPAGKQELIDAGYLAKPEIPATLTESN